MQEQHLFEYAVIRIVPKVEREEFLNIGVILYCRDQNFLHAKYHLDTAKLKALSTELDIAEIEDYLRSICSISEGTTNSGPIGSLPMADRYRWLTATRSTIVQCSKTHPGLCKNSEVMLEQLFQKLVL